MSTPVIDDPPMNYLVTGTDQHGNPVQETIEETPLTRALETLITIGRSGRSKEATERAEAILAHRSSDR